MFNSSELSQIKTEIEGGKSPESVAADRNIPYTTFRTRLKDSGYTIITMKTLKAIERVPLASAETATVA